MTKIITIEDIKTLVHQITIEKFFEELIAALKEDYSNWHDFLKTPRHATHLNHGVIEVMPICGKDYYAAKYVNGHPNNPDDDKLTVVALGILAEIKNGYPVLISEMTLLTALRTAATSALAGQYLARKNTRTMALIGTGSQSEFQVLAHKVGLGISRFKYFDTDPKAMKKFANNLKNYALELIPCDSIESVIKEADVITTATAAKAKMQILQNDMIQPGTYINGIGGDCPGKTELDPNILLRSKVVIEHMAQTKHEGEIQHVDAKHIHAELWELVTGEKPGRENDEEITVFDSVGFAIEDYSTLKYVYRLAEEHQLGLKLDLIPNLEDPKNLFSLLL